MDFNFTEEQRILKETARDLLEKECPSSLVLEMEDDQKGYTPQLWKKMAELGWMALIIPEDYEGVGGNYTDLIVMLEEMGRVCLPGPFFSTIGLGAIPIMVSGNQGLADAYLPKVATGDMILTMAHLEAAATKYDPYLIESTAIQEGDDYVLNGSKLFVPDAHVADHMITVVRTSGDSYAEDGLSLFIIDTKSPGITITPLKTIAGDKQFGVGFSDVRVSGEGLMGPLNQGAGILQVTLEKAAIGKCAEMVGGAQKVLDMATAYAKEREQFGRLIGSFQAVQHHCANMLMDIEGSRYVTYKVAWMLNEGMVCRRQVAAAKGWVSEAYKRVVARGHQVLGATAYMVEHEMPLYSRRAKIAEVAFGDASYHRAIMARELGL
jgi:alkylation response protein AidB-like acyl-CoA dehydrogenase